MGARVAMTIAARYPDRIDRAISVDAAPVDERMNNTFGFVKEVVSHIYKLQLFTSLFS